LTLGVDYFLDEYSLKKKLQINYGWIGPAGIEFSFLVETDVSSPRMKKKPKRYMDEVQYLGTIDPPERSIGASSVNIHCPCCDHNYKSAILFKKHISKHLLSSFSFLAIEIASVPNILLSFFS